MSNLLSSFLKKPTKSKLEK